MARFCKRLLVFMITATVLPSVIAFASLVLLAICFLFSSTFPSLGWLFVTILVTVPGTLIALVGAVLGWIGGFLGKIVLSIISVILVSIGVAVWFVFIPWCSAVVFIIALALGLICIKKQKKHNEFKENR